MTNPSGAFKLYSKTIKVEGVKPKPINASQLPTLYCLEVSSMMHGVTVLGVVVTPPHNGLHYLHVG